MHSGHVKLVVAQYPPLMGWAGFLSMAIFRLPLFFSSLAFWKLMGSGKNGTFDIRPDWRKWAIILFSKEQQNPTVPHFISNYWKLFQVTTTTYLLQPIEGHGLWDGKEVFGKLPKQTDYEGEIAVLTRATIRLNKLNAFWKNVDSVANQMSSAEGFKTSIGIGEVPFVKQATFSIWESKLHMKNFAYKMHQHAEVIRKTKKENWYSEEMFVRFKIIKVTHK